MRWDGERRNFYVIINCWNPQQKITENAILAMQLRSAQGHPNLRNSIKRHYCSPCVRTEVNGFSLGVTFRPKKTVVKRSEVNSLGSGDFKQVRRTRGI